MAPITRRDLSGMLGMVGVAGLSRSLFPAWMPRLAFRSPESVGQQKHGDVLVAVFQRGGMDGLNVVVPYGDGAAYYDMRPTIGIAEPGKGDKSAIDLDGHFGLHPSLRGLKDVFDQGHLAVIHATGSPDPSRSHFEAMEFMERGTPGERLTGTGWINRHLETAAWQNNSPFRAVGMGAMVQSSLQGAVPALALRSIADFHLRGREEQVAAIQKVLQGLYSIQSPTEVLSQQAAEVFSTIDLLTRLSSTEYQPANGAKYPDTDYGYGLQQVAQLVKADVGLEVACVDIGGWDTHEAEGGADGQMAYPLDELGNGLAAFYADLRDYAGGVVVVTMSEFGRRVQENQSRGTDHGHGNCMFVMGSGAGAGVNGGVYAKWPGLTPDKLDDGDLAITIDYRDTLAEIVRGRLQNSAVDKIFPGYAPKPLGIVRS
jgi:uncharacterized protein (DUF1501 family)